MGTFKPLGKIFKAQKKMASNYGHVPHTVMQNKTKRGYQDFTYWRQYGHINVFIYQQNNVHRHDHDTRSKNKLRILKHRVRKYENSPFFSGVQIYSILSLVYKSFGNAHHLYRKFRQFLVHRSFFSLCEFMQDEVVIYYYLCLKHCYNPYVHIEKLVI